MPADRRFPDWVRHSGVGLELAGAVAGFALLGYWVDRHYGTQPWGLVTGFVLGIVGGLYNFVREALQATREAKQEDTAARIEARDDSGRSSNGD